MDFCAMLTIVLSLSQRDSVPEAVKSNHNGSIAMG